MEENKKSSLPEYKLGSFTIVENTAKGVIFSQSDPTPAEEEQLKTTAEEAKRLMSQAIEALRGLGYRDEDIAAVVFYTIKVTTRNYLEEKQKRRQQQEMKDGHKI